MKANTPVFILLTMATTLFTITSTNSMFMWMMMELNMLTFIPLICLEKSTTEADISLKYLIPQSLASSLFMLSIILSTFGPFSKALASTALLMKAGSVPMHTWFPVVMYSMNMLAGFTLMTWQKIVPLFLLSIPQLSFTPLILISALMSALWGSIAGLNQTNIISMLTFSSIAHLSWLISASLLSIKALSMYLMSYALTLLPIFMAMNISNMKTHKTAMCGMMEKHLQIALALSLLSLAGLPPLAMFSNKIIVIYLMNKTIMMLILLFMLLSAAISLYFYVILVFTMMFDFSMPLESTNKMTSPKMVCILSFLFQLSPLFLSLYPLF
uniref:NADH-ubiquinone oxidoreductase chain 2 n=1 Tax=Unio tumidus TaxID=143298 RepID=A0A1Q1MMP9_9BIVA|nr:NADH dehydrogenase subunit 2 [Unio tumidus]AQM37813.1 NADH dehydrogenase subunit 2 [Unio tumidus]AQM37827.1 NADH dehydrogenase subunit 2 [Unio tumidus]